MRLIEHTPKKWARFLKTHRPISESIVPLRSNRTKNWSAMSAKWIVGYARWYTKVNEIGTRGELANIQGGLYKALRKRNLLDRVKFNGDERAWSRYSDDALVRYVQNFVEEKKIKNRTTLQRVDVGLYNALVKRGLLDSVRFREGLRSWTKYSDERLAEYARRFVHENGIESRNGLAESNRGLYSVLWKRKLLERVEFKADERAWRLYSDNGLVECAQMIVDMNCISRRTELLRFDRSLYEVLARRRLLDSVRFRKGVRSWTKHSDERLAEYARRFVHENGIETRKALERIDGGLYQALCKRQLMGRIEFKADERAWKRYSDDELVAYAQNFVVETRIASRSNLNKVDGGLYQALVIRKLIGRVFSDLEQNQEAQGINEIADALGEFGGEECD